MNKTNFFREMLSENGIVSSKRVNGTLSYLVCLGVLVALVIKEGGTDTVESIVQTVLICSMGLLGISSVTSAIKGGGGAKIENNEKKE